MESKLKFRDNGKYKIIQFTDIHWESEEERLDKIDLQTGTLFKKIIGEEKPDLVILTGDMISGGLPNAPKVIRSAVMPVSQCKIPFATVFGNHDVEGIFSKEQLIKAQQEVPGCFTKMGDSCSGLGNYVLEIQRSREDKTSWVFYMMDSGNNPPDPKYGTDNWIRRYQIDWYMEKSSEINKKKGRTIPALVFFHIPLPEFNDVWDNEICYGSKDEKVCCPMLNSGFFSAMVERGDVKGVFVGHDHYNDYCGKLHGIWLCYGRATGYRTHKKDIFAYGARIIELDENTAGFDTWIRLNDGSRICDVNCY